MREREMSRRYMTPLGACHARIAIGFGHRVQHQTWNLANDGTLRRHGSDPVVAEHTAVTVIAVEATTTRTSLIVKALTKVAHATAAAAGPGETHALYADLNLSHRIQMILVAPRRICFSLYDDFRVSEAIGRVSLVTSADRLNGEDD